MHPVTNGPCPTSDERVRLFGLLYETSARLVRNVSGALEDDCDLPWPWFDVLLQLRRSSDGRLKMSQLADATVHSSGGTTRLIDRVEAAGLVARQHCPEDRRAIYVAITPDGNERLDVALSAHLAHLETVVTDRLSRPEREQLSGLLAKLNRDR